MHCSCCQVSGKKKKKALCFILYPLCFMLWTLDIRFVWLIMDLAESCFIINLIGSEYNSLGGVWVSVIWLYETWSFVPRSDGDLTVWFFPFSFSLLFKSAGFFLHKFNFCQSNCCYGYFIIFVFWLWPHFLFFFEGKPNICIYMFRCFYTQICLVCDTCKMVLQIFRLL